MSGTRTCAICQTELPALAGAGGFVFCDACRPRMPRDAQRLADFLPAVEAFARCLAEVLTRYRNTSPDDPERGTLDEAALERRINELDDDAALFRRLLADGGGE